MEVRGIDTAIQAEMDRDFMQAIRREPTKARYNQCMLNIVTAEQIIPPNWRQPIVPSSAMRTLSD